MTKETKRLIEELIRAGEMCASICHTLGRGDFNYATDPRNEHAKQSMRESLKAWDMALQNYRAAESMKRL